MPTPPPEQKQPVAFRLLDALVNKACRADPELVEELARRGIVVDGSRSTFTLGEFRTAIDLARQHQFGHLSEEDGAHELGRSYIKGVAETAVGSILAGIARLIGADRTLGRMSTYVRTGGRSDMRASLTMVASREWRVRVDDTQPVPHFARGVLDGIVEICGEQPESWLIHSEPTWYELGVRWPPR